MRCEYVIDVCGARVCKMRTRMFTWRCPWLPLSVAALTRVDVARGQCLPLLPSTHIRHSNSHTHASIITRMKNVLKHFAYQIPLTHIVNLITTPRLPPPPPPRTDRDGWESLSSSRPFQEHARFVAVGIHRFSHLKPPTFPLTQPKITPTKTDFFNNFSKFDQQQKNFLIHPINYKKTPRGIKP